MLFNNISVVESVFAAMRTANMDSAALYAIGASSMNLQTAASSIDKGKCYSRDQIGNVKLVGADISLSTLKRADEIRSKHMQQFNSVTAMNPKIITTRFTVKFDTDKSQLLLTAMAETWSGQSLTAKVFKSEYYQYNVRLSVKTNYETCFDSVKSMESDDQLKLETFAWSLMIKSLDLSQGSSKRKEVDKFNVNLIQYR